MRIGLVFTGSFRGAGVERIVHESARHLGRRHDVTVLADSWEDCGTPGVRYEHVHPRMRPRALVPLSFARRSARAAARGGFDRTISYGVNCPGGDVLWVNSVHAAWLERKRAQSPRHALRVLRPADQALLSLERDRYGRRNYRQLFAVSEQVAEDLVRLYGVPREHVEIVPNGFAPEEFSPERRARLRAEVRAELGLADDDVAILIVANELERKGFHVLVDAVRLVGDPRFKILLAGRAEPPSAPDVRWLGALQDVGRAHAAADLFVLPTRYEAACLAIVEALGSGLPVITTDVPGARDHVVPGVTGAIQRDPHDADELAGLLRLALDPRLRAAWADAAAPSVAHLRWPVILDRVEALLSAHDLGMAA